MDYRTERQAIHKRIELALPMVIQNFRPVVDAVGHWSFSHLYDTLGSKPEYTNDFTVFTSKKSRFMYHNDENNHGEYVYAYAHTRDRSLKKVYLSVFVIPGLTSTLTRRHII
jgi:hypothetical protein